MISELRQKYPLKDLLSIAGVPRSTYYYYLKRMQQPDKYRVENVYCIIKMYIIADEKCAKLHVQNAHFCRAF